MPTNSKHPETIALHAGSYRADPATTAVAVPIYQTTSYQFNSTEHAGQPVRAQGAGQHLHPHHESDAGRAGRARRRARRRRRRAGGRLRSGGLAVRGAEHLPCRRQFRLLDRHLRRHLEPVREHDEAPWASSAASSIRPIPENFRTRDRRAHPLLVRRDAAQPEARRLPDRGGRQDRPRDGRAADHGQHGLRRCCAGRSSTAPPSSCIRPPSISAATAPRSAASSSTAAISTGRSTPTASRCSTRPTPAITARCGPRPSSRSGPIAYIIKARVTLLRDIGAAMSPVQRLPCSSRGWRPLPLRMRAALRERRRGRRLPREAPQGRQGHLSRA